MPAPQLLRSMSTMRSRLSPMFTRRSPLSPTSTTPLARLPPLPSPTSTTSLVRFPPWLSPMSTLSPSLPQSLRPLPSGHRCPRCPSCDLHPRPSCCRHLRRCPSCRLPRLSRRCPRLHLWRIHLWWIPHPRRLGQALNRQPRIPGLMTNYSCGSFLSGKTLVVFLFGKSHEVRDVWPLRAIKTNCKACYLSSQKFIYKNC